MVLTQRHARARTSAGAVLVARSITTQPGLRGLRVLLNTASSARHRPPLKQRPALGPDCLVQRRDLVRAYYRALGGRCDSVLG